MYKYLIYLFLSLVFANNLFAQNIIVKSEEDKQSIPGATILCKDIATNKEQIFVTDGSGVADLSVFASQSTEYIIQISFVGFTTLTQTVHKPPISRLEINSPVIYYLKSKNFSLNQIVITAQYEPTTAEKSIQKVKIIDSKKIQAMGAVNLRDVLTNEMNIRLSQDNILGGSLVMQGISGENVKILVDGVPMIGRLNGTIDLSQVNMNNVERIEIVEGPLSVQYGTNALAGTINIITIKNSTKKKNISVTPYYESSGNYNLTGDALLSIKKHTIHITGGRNYFDGWNPGNQPFLYISHPIADTTRFQQWKPKEQYFVNAGYTYQFKKIVSGFKSSYFDEKITNRGLPRAPYNETSFDDYYYTKRIDNSIYTNGKINKHWYLNLIAAYNHYQRIKNTFFKDLTTLEQTITSPPDQDTSAFGLWMSRASLAHTKDSSLFNYELGYDVSYESVLSKRIENQLRYMGDYALYATSEYKPVKKIVFKPGLRYAYNTTYRAPLIPSLNAKWDILDKHVLRASYAKGFRAPALKELYFLFVDINHNIIGNQNLKAEQSNNYSLAYSFISSLKNVRLKIDYSLFYNNITNLITLAQVLNTQYSYINIGKYKTKGFQFSSSINYKGFNVAGGFNYTGRYNQIAEEYKVARYSYSPEYNLNTSYKFQKQKIVVSLFYKYNGKLPGYQLTGNEVQQAFIAACQIMDGTVSKDLIKDHINITVGCKNIFNVTNIASNLSGGVHSANANSMPLLTGRNYFIKLIITLWKN